MTNTSLPLTRYHALRDMTEVGLEVYPRSAYEGMSDRIAAMIVAELDERQIARRTRLRDLPDGDAQAQQRIREVGQSI